ncbi:MAG: hypothetical protein CVT78_08340 [Alphaproteobacteria bacterium HGW-Alphaproteobacteria-17]|nr:MAG: hypothetical protein CVT78_08340 [Alphaproteobacteria bacterium HGW-Alphaproteobacteria-17]
MVDRILDVATATRLVEKGGLALQRGDAVSARDALHPITEAGLANAQVWLMLGEAHRQLGELEQLAVAADALLAFDAKLIRAMIWKAECLQAANDLPGAASWYGNALRQSAIADRIPPSLQPLIREAEAAAAEIDAAFGAALEAGLNARGLPPTKRSPSFRRAIAIMRGEEAAEMDLQRPSSFYFPDLPQRRFFEREEFDWVPAVEAATDVIRTELQQALADPALFKPYLSHTNNRPRVEFGGMHDNPSWSALHLVDKGVPVPSLVERFPATLAALEAVPQCHISVRSPSIMFSLLQPGAHIAPHHGMINGRLICHLPLVVPGDGALTVGGEARRWEEGKLLIFDDSIEHEAINRADSDRIVLLFDVWRPELSEEDRRGIAALFETVDTYR